MLVKELENATKQIQFHPNKTHFLETTWNYPYIADMSDRKAGLL